jgi:hypothetical protein
MVLWHICDVHYTTHTSWGHTPTLSSHPVYHTGPHDGTTQGPPRMVDTRHPSQPVGQQLPTPGYFSTSRGTDGPIRTLQHRCRGTLSQGEHRANSLSPPHCHPKTTSLGRTPCARLSTPPSPNRRGTAHRTHPGLTHPPRGHNGEVYFGGGSTTFRPSDTSYQGQTAHQTPLQSFPPT